jgi:hypothetical protein
MKIQPALNWLVPLIALLALVAAGVGLFSQSGSGPFPFTTIRGEVIEIYGQGLYRYDTPLIAVGNRVGDGVLLVLGIPLLIISFVLYQRGSRRGGLLLAGALAYFLYIYVSLAIGAVYNDFFIVYIVILAASLFGLITTLLSFDAQMLPAHFSARLPHRGIGIYLIVSGIILCLVWLVLSIIPALLQGSVPAELKHYTTFITGAIDLGIIAPALVIAGRLILRREPPGYLLAPVLLVFTVVLGTGLTVAGIAQLMAKLVSIGQFIGFTAGFSLLTFFAVWFAIILFRDFSEVPSGKIAMSYRKEDRNESYSIN